MAQTKTFFGRLIRHVVDGLGSIFHAAMSGAEKTFNQLSPEAQNALIHGSGIMALIGSMVTNSVAEVRSAIQKEFPDVNEAALEAGLLTIAHNFNLLPNTNSVDDIIAKLQAHIAANTGNAWNSIMNSGANLLAVIFAPAGTEFAAVTSLMEYVYQTYFAKKTVATPVAT